MYYQTDILDPELVKIFKVAEKMNEKENKISIDDFLKSLRNLSEELEKEENNKDGMSDTILLKKPNKYMEANFK